MCVVCPTMTDIVGYCRISQDVDGTGYSVENQKHEIQRWAAERGHRITEFFVDNSISATKERKRPGFEALLASANKRVVVWTHDRLLRVSKDLERVLDAKLEVYQVQASGVLDLSTPQGRAVARTITAWATFEGEQKAERQKVSHLGLVRRGVYLGKVDNFGQTRTGELIEPEASAVRDAAKRLATYKASFFEISREWNEKGLYPPIRRNNKRNHWSGSTVKRFFESPRLKGIQVYKGIEYPLDWEPLLDDATWGQIQVRIESRKTGPRKKTSEKHLLSGLLKCEICDTGLTSAHRSNGQHLYRCPVAASHPTVTKERADEYISEFALHLLARRNEEDGEEAKHAQRVAEIAAQLNEEERKHQTWMTEAAEAGLSPSVMAARQQTFDTTTAQLRAEFANLQSTMASDLTKDNAAGWQTAPVSQKRELLDTIFSRIVVKKAGRGANWNPDRLVCHFTPYGEEMYERFGKDELPDTSSWAALRGKPPKKGRTYTPNSERMTLEEFFGVTGDMPSKEKEA